MRSRAGRAWRAELPGFHAGDAEGEPVGDDWDARAVVTEAYVVEIARPGLTNIPAVVLVATTQDGERIGVMLDDDDAGAVAKLQGFVNRELADA